MENSADDIAALRARVAITEALAQAFLLNADLPALLTASAAFNSASEGVIADLLQSSHADAANESAQQWARHWTVELAKAVGRQST